MRKKAGSDAERLEHIAAKVPSSLKREIDRIVKKERRNKSNVVWLLLERGLHEYRRDSKLTGWEIQEVEEGRSYPLEFVGEPANMVHESPHPGPRTRRKGSKGSSPK